MAKAAMIPRPPVPPLSLDGVGELERAYAAAPQRGAASDDGSALSRGEEQLLSPPQRLSLSVVLQVNEVLERHAHGCGISVVRCIDGRLRTITAATDAPGVQQHDVVTVTAVRREQLAVKGCATKAERETPFRGACSARLTRLVGAERRGCCRCCF